MSRYSVEDIYCYPGSSVLRNKLGLKDQDQLDQYEAEITALRLVELQEKPIKGHFDLEHLKKLHFHIFQDVYDWAGEIRTVDISRGTSHFAHAQYIESAAKTLFANLKKENWLKELDIDGFSLKAAHYLSEINVLHPFREGNGRAQRAFITQLCRDAGYDLDYSDLEQNELFDAMKEAYQGDEHKIAQILRERLTENTELAKIVEGRLGGKTVKVKLEDL